MFPSTTTIFLALAAGIASVAGGPVNGSPRTRNCGTHISDVELLAAERHFKINAVPPGRQLMGSGSGASPVINIYWHVIRQDDTLEGGNVPDSQINDQVDVLNKAYAPTGLSFNLVNISRSEVTVNAEWFHKAGPETLYQDSMKNTLRIGGPSDLNIYSVGFTDLPKKYEGVLGYATFPKTYKEEPQDDGIVLLFSSLPGGSSAPFNEGHTLTHEIGHWVGLYHTFQGGCGAVGDQVHDTVSEAIPSSGCPVGRKTCKNAEGLDPINNFMDYSQDSCLTEFTKGQIERLQAQMRTYREVEFPTPKGAES
ncbi:hypothetical protein HGRIS_011083 [Hohenbuehelia grisea]|uniref:Peptidase M43 pregnancy-associated plasma-A domain-containing protein n=1 Tax=Hohenbuehelia grisea TaxID=104357 RepID=A0ABR3IZ73_9AGAR